MDYIYDDGGRGNYFDTKYKKDRTNDCVIRAIAIATEGDYLAVWEELFILSTKMGFMPNDKKCYEEYLELRGWTKNKPLRKINGKKYKVKNLPINKNKSYIVKTTRHLTAIIDVEHRDIWDCGNWCANSYYT